MKLKCVKEYCVMIVVQIVIIVSKKQIVNYLKIAIVDQQKFQVQLEFYFFALFKNKKILFLLKAIWI